MIASRSAAAVRDDAPAAAGVRRCPYCHERARWRELVACARCGAALSALDALRPWRRLRRLVRRLRVG